MFPKVPLHGEATAAMDFFPVHTLTFVVLYCHWLQSKKIARMEFW